MSAISIKSKLMKNSFLYLTIGFLLAVIAACDNQDEITMQNFDISSDIQLITTQKSIELGAENASDLALQFAWNIPQFTLSKYALAANAMTTSLQFATDSTFTTYTSVTTSGNAASFTGSALNSVVNKLTIASGTATAFYIRLAVSAGKNIDPLYSNTAIVTIKPYTIDYKNMYMGTDASLANTFATLYSPNENGEYSGFVSTPSTWYSFYFIAADGTAYGNTATDGTAFYLTADAGMWNCWFPATSGCHYVTMDANNMNWTATWMPSIEADGSASGTLTYSSSTGLWTGTITTTSANAEFRLKTDGQRYTPTTGDADYATYTFYLCGNGSNSTNGNLTFSETGDSGSIVIPQAGKYTLSVNLTNSRDYTYSWMAAGEDNTTYPDQLFLHDKTVDDAYYATLYPREDHVYEGFYQASAWDGFYLTSTGSLSQGIIYGYAPSENQNVISSVDASAFNADSLYSFWTDNDSTQYYYLRADLSGKTMTYEKINGFYVTGDFNNWSTTSNAMTYNAGTKTWTATCTIDEDANGLQILADVDGASSIWDYKMATVAGSDSSGELDWFSRNGSVNIPVSEAGTYVITIDLSNSEKYTYSIVKQ